MPNFRRAGAYSAALDHARWCRAMCATSALAASACAQLEATGTPVAESVLAVTESHELIRFNAGQPGRIVDRKAISGLQQGDSLVGIDFRVARGVLYAHTGAAVDADGAAAGVQPDANLAWLAGDVSASLAPALLAAAYTYNKQNDKLTTNFAIERRGLLVTQGSREGVQPVLSPNSGRLATVGALGTGPIDDAAFDIADVSGAAYAALRSAGRTTGYRIDLASGSAARIGSVDGGGRLRGVAIEP